MVLGFLFWCFKCDLVKFIIIIIIIICYILQEIMNIFSEPRTCDTVFC